VVEELSAGGCSRDRVLVAAAARWCGRRSLPPPHRDRLGITGARSAQVTVTAPSEIVLYARAFEKLSGLAVYCDEARARIADAIRAL
jgi:hypothetical protein